MYTTTELLDLDKTIAADIFADAQYPWLVLDKIKEFIIELGEKLPRDEYEKTGDNVWIARDAVVYQSAHIAGPCIIDHGAEIRHCAFIRGSAIIGKNAVVGNSAELKNAILFDNVQVPHFNYVGDSVLGYKAHMGAGSIVSNVKGDRTDVIVHSDDETIETGLRKFGAILGDHAEIGCNSVINPGAIIGRRATVYPTSSVRGTVPADSIYKNSGEIIGRY